MKAQSVKSTAQRSHPVQDVQELIRLRAYELYEERGRQDGHELDDWLAAEAEVTQAKVKQAAA